MPQKGLSCEYLRAWARPRQRITQRRAISKCVRCAILVCICCHTGLAQTNTVYNPTSTRDAYGNARPLYLSRRSVGLFGNDVQRRALRGFQAFGRRSDRRGGFNPFALAPDLYARPRPRSTYFSAYPSAVDQPARQRRQTFQRYGGFESRGAAAQYQDLSTVFERRYALIAATSLNAPVHRALLATESAFGRRSISEPASRGPSARMETEEEVEFTPIATLSLRLRTSVDDAHRRIRSEAWVWFGKREYRRAVRAFETATSLEQSDAESRIGEILSHLSLGAVRTALAVFGELIRRDENPFVYELNLASASGYTARTRMLRIRQPLQAMASSTNPDFRALRGLVLWHLGEHDEALVATTIFLRELPSAKYADWPAKMRAAKAALAAENGPS